VTTPATFNDLVHRTGGALTNGFWPYFTFGATAVFTCANRGRFSTDYDAFSVELTCFNEDTEPTAKTIPSPWPTCKTGKERENTTVKTDFLFDQRQLTICNLPRN
jgi:hypothetical protein